MRRVRVSREPMASPMGIIAISAPREKRPIPRMSSTAPAKNSSTVPMGMGTTVTLRASRMAVMGSTEERASITFSRSFWFIFAIPFRLSINYYYTRKRGDGE